MELQLTKNGNVQDSVPVSWNTYTGEPLRVHVDYNAYGDDMIRAHVLTQDWNRIGTVQMHDTNRPNADSQFGVSMVGDRSYEGQVYVDAVKTTQNQIYTDDFEEAGLQNWSGTYWSTNSNGVLTETEDTFNNNRTDLTNSNIQLDATNGISIQYDSNLAGDFANYNNFRLVSGAGNYIARTGHGDDAYNNKAGNTRAYAGDSGNEWTQRSYINDNGWQNVQYTYNPYTNQCTVSVDNGSESTTCTGSTDDVAQEITLSGWSHNQGDTWRDFFVRAHSNDGIQFSTNINGTVYDDSFENYSLGSSPWIVDNDSSTDDIKVSNNRASDGSQSLRSIQPNTGAPSHFDAAVNFGGVSNTATVVEYTADVYVDSKENGGTADDFSLRLLDSSSTDTNSKAAFNVNMVQNGNSISADGTDVRNDIRNQWVNMRMVVDYSQNEYELYVNGNYEGTFTMPNSGNPEEFDHFVHRNDNYDGYIDNVTITPLS
jgi:hypothetical protein